MLRTVNELLGCRVLAEGRPLGRVKDVYFDTGSWQVRHVLAAFSAQHSRDDLRLISPGNFAFPANRDIELPLSAEAARAFPFASTVKPVCKQYELFRFGSPRTAPAGAAADPHLRSWATIRPYAVEHDGRTAGFLSDLVIHEHDWSIAYLKISQTFSGKTLHFHIVPVKVQTISFARQRLVLSALEPVHLNDPAELEPMAIVRAA